MKRQTDVHDPTTTRGRAHEEAEHTTSGKQDDSAKHSPPPPALSAPHGAHSRRAMYSSGVRQSQPRSRT